MKIITTSLKFLLLLISDSQCGLVNGVFGVVTNTTHVFANNVGGILSLRRGHIFGKKKNGPTEAGVVQHRNGLICRFFNSIQDNAKNCEERIKNVFLNMQTRDNGVLGNIIIRVINHIINVKHFLFGNNEKPQKTETIHKFKPTEIINKTHANVMEKTKPIRNFLNNHLFGNNIIMNMHYNDTVKGLEDMKEKYSNNDKPGINNPHTTEKPEDGAGLKAAIVNVKEEAQKFTKEMNITNVHIPHDTGDIGKQVHKLKSTIETSINGVQSNVKNIFNRNGFISF